MQNSPRAGVSPNYRIPSGGPNHFPRFDAFEERARNRLDALTDRFHRPKRISIEEVKSIQLVIAEIAVQTGQPFRELQKSLWIDYFLDDFFTQLLINSPSRALT